MEDNDKIARVASAVNMTAAMTPEELERLASFPLLNPNPVIEVDYSGKITFINAATERVLEHLGLDKGNATLFVPSDFEALLKDMDAGGVSRFYREMTIKGRTFKEAISCAPEFKAVRIYAHDITPRIQEEEAQRTKKEYDLAMLFFAVEHINEEIILADKDARIVFVNQAACRAMGYSKDEFLNLGVSDIDSDFQMEDWPSHWQEVKERGSLWFESSHRTRDGRSYPVEISASYFEYSGFGYLFGIARDVAQRRRFESALHISQLHLSEAQRIAQIGSWDWDATTDTIAWSEEYYRIYGFDPALPPPNYLEHLKAYTAESAGRLDVAVKKSMETGEPYELDLELANPTETAKWICARGEAKKNAKGIIVGLRGTAQNISTRKRMEEQIKHSESVKTVMNNIAGVFLTVPEEEVYGEVLKIVREVMKSRHGVFGFMADNGDLVIPSMTREVWSECQIPDKTIVFSPHTWGKSLWGRAIREKKAFYSNEPFCVPEGHIQMENFLTAPVVFKDKTIGLLSVGNKEGGYTEEDKDLHVLIANSISPILSARLERDSKEKERMLAEDGLKRSEAFMRSLIEGVDVGFIVIDRNYTITSANRAFCDQHKTRVEDVIGRHCYEVSHNLQKPCFVEGEECAPRRTFQTGGVHAALHIHRDKEGALIYIETKCFPMEDASGEVYSVIETLNDITEKRRLEEQLRHVQKMEAIGTLAGGIAHDFNNILNIILGYASLMQMHIKENDPSLPQLKEILAAGDRAAHLTKALLTFSRKQVMEIRKVNVNDVVEGFKKMLARIIGEDIELRIMKAKEDLIVKADVVQLEQVLMNLAGNARDAMPKGGTLAIETVLIRIDRKFMIEHAFGEPGQYALITVSDTGSGMDEKTRERIFEPFFTTKELGRGTGLGLSIVYGIVKQHSGYITCYSEPGKGTTFKIYIPLIKAEAEKIVEAEALTVRGGKETILLAEDDAGVRDFMKDVLKAHGYRIIEAVDGEDAVKKFRESKERIDLLLFDLIMPKKNGKDAYEVIKTLKEDAAAVFMSGYAADIIQKFGIEDGIAFVSKPVLPTELLRKVRETLDRHGE